MAKISLPNMFTRTKPPDEGVKVKVAEKSVNKSLEKPAENPVAKPIVEVFHNHNVDKPVANPGPGAVAPSVSVQNVAPTVAIQQSVAAAKDSVAETKPAQPQKQQPQPEPVLENIAAAKDKVAEILQRGPRMSIIDLVDSMIEQAHNMRASDVHIDPHQSKVIVRYRIDGVLQDAHEFPKLIHGEVISRIKILAGLRTDEHQAAQDGRFRTTLNGDVPVDVRVSIAPIYFGENAVMRLLSDKAEQFSLESLGFSKDNQKKILHAIQRPYGMILATGPTGSGKTTTLYTILKMLNTKKVSIITIEDPIEYAIEGIEQMQVNARTALTFANGLRSILRQDPNIIMVGEIRDAETAGIAVNTALTGHLLLSTLHTNDAATTLPRLLDMGVESYLIASTVNVAIGQRLVRKICADCKVERELTPAETKNLNSIVKLKKGEQHAKFYAGAGCKSCNNTGYLGRIGLHEVLVVDNVLRDAIHNKASAAELQKLAIEQGMVPMIEDGLAKARAGITTVEEVLRMLYE
jgi:type IV pilus assembly protein PilB